MRVTCGRFPVTAGGWPSRPFRSALLGFVVILLCAVFAAQASAASGSWSSQGPSGGHVYALAIDPANPQNLYAATGGAGVFTSTNGGASWSAANTGLTNTFVYSLEFDPANPRALYAGTGQTAFRA